LSIVRIVRIVRFLAKNLTRGFLMRFLVLVLFAAVMGCGGDDDLTPVEARVALKELGIDYTESKFLDAVKRGDLVVVKLFLQAGMSVNAAPSKGVTALLGAASYGHLSVVRYLVGQGADVNAKDDIGWTALHFAAREGQLEVVRYLVEHGAAVNATTNHGDTALHFAAGRGQLEVVRYLVEHGADVNARDYSGRTPRDWAAYCSTDTFISDEWRARCAAVVEYLDSLAEDE